VQYTKSDLKLSRKYILRATPTKSQRHCFNMQQLMYHD